MLGIFLFSLALIIFSISVFFIWLKPGKFILGNKKEIVPLTPSQEKKFEIEE